MRGPSQPGRDVLAAVLLPLLCAGVLVLVRPSGQQAVERRPVETPLASSAVLCPAALVGSTGDSVRLTSLTQGRTGEIALGADGATSSLRLRSGRVASATPPDGGALVVTGAGDLAPGLLAGRSTTAPLAAVDCAPTSPERWFSAVGASPTHDSVLQLANPGPGVAVADIAVRAPNGLLDIGSLRGVTVPGGDTASLDLGAILPRRGELSLEVHTSRGRLAASVADTIDQLGGGLRVVDWLPGQAAPATSNVLLGLAPGIGERTLVLANPGATEVRAEVRLITPDAVFAPAGLEPIRVAADSTESVSLDDVVALAVQDGAIGIEVESTGPLTASLRQVVDGDLSLLAPGEALTGTTGAVVPVGAKRLLLAGPPGSGSATVTAYAAGGRAVATQDVTLVPDTGADVTLPEQAVLVTIATQGTSVRAAILIGGTGAGTAVLSVREVARTGLVPSVRPGLP